MKTFARSARCAALGLATLAALPAAAAAHAGHDPAGKGGAKPPKAQPARSIAIQFAGVAGSKPVSCGAAIAELGTTRRTADLLDFRFFVSDVKLLRRDGRAVTLRLAKRAPWQAVGRGGAVTLIDLEDGTGACAGGTRGTNAVVRGTAPRGDYAGVRFTLGVPFALNHTDATTAPAPLNSAAMAWSWQVGRKFAKIEVTDPGEPDAAWEARTFFVHMGSTGCRGDPATGQTVRCGQANRAQIALRRFDARKQQIAVDVRALLAGNDVTKNGGGAPGCMAALSDPECGPVFGALGMPFHGTPGTGGDDDHGSGGHDHGAMTAAAAPRQTVFRPIPR